MHLDKYGLPVQADGDANDQLQRCGMIDASYWLASKTERVDLPLPLSERLIISVALVAQDRLQPKPGVYSRYVGGATNNVSADQLISALAAHVAAKQKRQIWLMFKSMCKRLGFAQNYKDGLNGAPVADEIDKLPDFMLLRALPLFCRATKALYPLACIADLLLVALALSAVGPVWHDGAWLPSKRGPDDVDDNNTILTLAVCSARMPTPLSWLARKLYTKLRPWNLGCTAEGGKDDMSTVSPPGKVVFRMHVTNNHHPVYGALRWYHRKESGGNPEIAELWKPICKRYFE